jgi:hypothetical protein
MSRHLDAMMMAATCGTILQSNNRYFSRPLLRFRPPEPFRPKFSSRREADERYREMFGKNPPGWRPRCARGHGRGPVLDRIRDRLEMLSYRR